jgi:hypothetical protein
VRQFALGAALAGVAAACEVPFFPPDAVTFEPPRAFANALQAMEACSGISGSWPRLRWFRVDSLPDGLEGAWDRPHHVFLTDFVLSDSVSDFYRQYVVQHEILHDLLQTSDHPQAFVDCGVP